MYVKFGCEAQKGGHAKISCQVNNGWNRTLAGHLNELIEKLEKSVKVCCIGKQFDGVLVYADDIKLLAHNLTALQSMVHMCKHFGDKIFFFFYIKVNHVY